MGESEPGPDIFLSYAREDEVRARQLAGALEQHGFAVFWDREIPPGETWHSHIGKALVHARCVVVAWSRHSIASDWVIEEASEGKRRRVLVPVLFEAVQPPFGFGGIQAASLIDWRPSRSSPAFDGLMKAIRRIVGGHVGSGTGPGSPPGAWSRRTVLAMVMGLFAIASGGATLSWWLTRPGPTTPAPMPQADVSTPRPAPSEPVVETEPSVTPPSPAPSEAHQPPDAMRDCPECPEMVLVPAGEFTMGSPPDEPGRDDGEGPQRQVTIAAPFWAGKYEVTFAEWDACVAAGGCSREPIDNGWGRDDRPVINVTWNDAKDYVGWLSEKAGKTYRLLSEAEWEYAERGESETAYWWGDDVGRNNANCAGCGSEWDNLKTAPVGSFRANDFGLYDTAGNVWEWVEDCWHDSYEGAPVDGSSWEGDCSTRVLRGGSWGDYPGGVRSAYRVGDASGFRSDLVGFRVARAPD